MTGKPPAVVFGLFETGLAVARNLGRRGVQVFGVDHKKDIGSYSRYVRPMRCPHPVRDRHAFLEWLETTFNKGSFALPAFITGDDFLSALSEGRERLGRRLHIHLPDRKLLAGIADKYSQYQLAVESGVEAPATWLIDHRNRLEAFRRHASWPLIVKGRNVNSWRQVYGGTIKGFVVHSFRELEDQAGKAVDSNVPVIVQEIIEGSDSSHFKYCAYVSTGGVTLAELCLKKIRQWPVGFGVGSAVESVEDGELLAAGRRFFRGIGYRGVGSVEFKRDERDGRLKLIELNPRYWQQNALAEACGVNFPWVQYLDLTGIAVKPEIRFQVGVKWINRYMDFSSFLAYRREGRLTYREWRRSLAGRKVYSDFAWDDQVPALHEIGFGKKLVKAPVTLWKRLSR